MAVLFYPTDEYTRSVLDHAKIHGDISLEDVEAILEDKAEISTDDVGDTIEALAAMGIEIDDGVTQEQRDAEFAQSMKSWVDAGNMLPSLTAEGWAKLVRFQERKKAPSAEEDAERREILSKRTFVQNLFAELGPRIVSG